MRPKNGCIDLLRRRLLCLCWLVLAGLAPWLATPACAGDDDAGGLSLAVLASRDKSVMQARYAPLATYLGTSLKTPVRLLVLTQSEIEQALRQHRIDLLLTNPSHYQMLRSTHSLTGALATLVSLENGMPVSALGGVIIARADRADLGGLVDLARLGPGRIAAPGKGFLGGVTRPRCWRRWKRVWC